MEYLYPKFRNAAAGFRKLVAAEILSLIGILLSGATAIASVFVFESFSDLNFSSELEGITDPNDISSLIPQDFTNAIIAILIFTILSTLITVIGYFMMLSGIIKAAKDEPIFISTLVVLTIGIVLTVLNAIFTDSTTLINQIVSPLANITHLVIVILILFGARRLMYNMGERSRKNFATVLIVLFFVLTFLLSGNYLSQLLPDDIGGDIQVILILLTGPLYAALYFLFFIFLIKAKKTLNYEY